MYLISTKGQQVKTRTIKGAINALQIAGYYTGKNIARQIRDSGAWHDDDQAIGIEKRDGRELRDVAVALSGD